MRLFGWRRKPSVRNPAPRLADPLERLRMLENEMRQVRLQVEFMRTRLSCYVGDGVALTYLPDETPIFVNANDIGGPFNLLNGGQYEEENVEALLSFVKDDTVFLDIGANVGLYTLRVARRVYPNGKIYSFEPNPQLNELLTRNVYVNGFANIVQSFQLGLSDRNCTATFQYPKGHLGGGHIDPPGLLSGHMAVEAEIRRLDDLLGPDFRCDLVKIDVEGHELQVLDGMKRIVENSPEIKILFEKLTPDAPTDSAIEDYFSGFGFELYGVDQDRALVPLGTGGLKQWAGYAFAARPGTIEGGLRRCRFSMYGGQMFKAMSAERGVTRQQASYGEILFHGPYWLLRSGIWRFRYHGVIHGKVRICILELFGYPVVDFLIGEGTTEHVFTALGALVHFECVGYAATPEAVIEFDRIELIREA
jgi:FkbM family methyltransferase